MLDKVEGLNDREEMLEHLRFLIRYEKAILKDGVIFSESEFYDELFGTIIMIADDLRVNESLEALSGASFHQLCRASSLKNRSI
jgi:hypothetical protein